MQLIIKENKLQNRKKQKKKRKEKGNKQPMKIFVKTKLKSL